MNDEFEPRTEESPKPSYSAVPQEPRKTEKKRRSGAGIIALALCFLLIGGAAGYFGAGMISDRAQSSQAMTDVSPAPAETEIPAAAESAHEAPAAPELTEAPSVQTPAPAENSVEAAVSSGIRVPMSAADVYEENVNSTVGITTSITTNYWGYQSSGAASGSGFIYSEDGYILTNYHVVEDSTSITVTTYDGTAYKAEIVGYDAENDVSVLKVDAEGLKPVTLGSSDQLRVGDEVLAIGNPLGELTFSLTKGWVSALNREVTLSSGTTMDLIQTDAAINSGNSGGALFNMYGEVVGITNAKYSSSGSSSSASVDNIGFAIPIDSVKRIVSQIIEFGHAVKPYIGVRIYTVTSEMLDYGLPQGAVINEVVSGSPAEAAGLMKNDIITSVNGESVANSSELKRIVSRSTPGDELVIGVYRQDKGDMEFTVVVTEQPEAAATPEPEYKQQWGGQQWGGSQNDDPFSGFPFGNFPFGNAG